jgi:ribosomal protein S18 acetylase RimI-like enzyme
MADHLTRVIRANYDRLATQYAVHLFDELRHKPFDREVLTRFALCAVVPWAQRKGIAQQLLSAAIDHCRSAGCTRVTLDTTTPLRAAIRFYEKNGFRATGRIADFFGMELLEYDLSLDDGETRE